MTYPTYQEASAVIADWESEMRGHIEQSILSAFRMGPNPNRQRVGFFNQAEAEAAAYREMAETVYVPRTIDRHMERAFAENDRYVLRRVANPTSSVSQKAKPFDPHLYPSDRDHRPPADATEIKVCSDSDCPCHQWQPGSSDTLYNVLHYSRDKHMRLDAQYTWAKESRDIKNKETSDYVAWDAHKRGRTLLRGQLSRSQWDNMRKNCFIEVKGGTTGHTYRIYYGVISNVATYLPDRKDEIYCVTGAGVASDVVLMQKLMIESDEETFLTLANTTLKWYPDGIRHS